MAGIKEIEIEGFKAFPNKFSLELDKNLLMYGENGSGKSSIYYALHALLQSVYKSDHGAKYFRHEDSEENLINIYKLDDVKNNGFKPHIKITLDNEHQWELSRDGLSSTPDTADDSELRLLNKTSAFINYSYISRFRSARNSETINLWNVFIKDILPFYVPTGTDMTLADAYYNLVENPYPYRVRRDIDGFNDNLSKFINEINRNASDIYNKYFKDEDEVDALIQVKYARDDDEIENPHHEEFQLSYRQQKAKSTYVWRYPKIGLHIVVGDKAILKPQSFFNEARLTAIALAIRFACLQSGKPQEGQFLALDDMLISLDMSNRMKVIRYLLDDMADKYKIYLFTHDKLFFEYLKHKSKKSSSRWSYGELYMQDSKEPYIRISRTYIEEADHYIKQHKYEIAGNFLRKEAESFCKRFLPLKWQYTKEYCLLDLNGLINNSKKFAEESGISDTTLFDELDNHRKFILNPASHDSYDIGKYEYEIKQCYNTLLSLSQISIRRLLSKGQKVKIELSTVEPVTFKFNITLCEDVYLIQIAGKPSYVSKGMINFTVDKNGTSSSEIKTDNTTLKKFYDKNYEKSDKKKDKDFLVSIVRIDDGRPIGDLL
ncbi:AAA family ATPase [Segatella maculosa]|uniref:AAA family ATPase n=1 Tax=Segatella maculosa TaxID=439703 RepID=UPI00036B497C|nr:AAA family ATPase [Segatella maculosa]